MSNRGPIAQEQLRELRTLSDLKASGQVSDAEYKRRKAAIYNRGRVLEATTRSVSGISGQAIRVGGSGGIPGIAKLAIYGSLMILGGYIAYEVFKPEPKVPSQDHTDDQATIAQAEPAVQTPVEQITTQPTPSADPVIDPDGPALFADIDPTPDPTDPLPDAHHARGETSALIDPGGLAEESHEHLATEIPADRPPNGVRPRPMADHAPEASPPWTPTRTRPPTVPVEYEKPTVLWPVNLPDAVLDRDHPYAEWCDITREIRRGNFKAKIGLTLGPEAVNLTDPDYITFRDEWRQTLINRVSEADPEGLIQFQPNKRLGKMNGTTVDRLMVRQPKSSKIGALVTTVQDGRCFAYWFEGHSALFSKFTPTVGKARVNEGTSEAFVQIPKPDTPAPGTVDAP